MAAVLSAADQELLNEEQQKQVLALKEQYAAATDQAGRDAAHAAAEQIRQSAAGGGYSGGQDGSGYQAAGSSVSGFQQTSSNPNTSTGGKSAQEMADYLDEYRRVNMNNTQGWTNGYSTAMNLRSMANAVRQEMAKNSEAWHTADDATKAYLHEQNVQLAKLLEENTGGAKSTYNPSTGQWETANANLGYGVNVGQYKPGDIQDVYYDQYQMTPEQIEAYRNDTSRYNNFVDQDLIRNWVDESNGYTGMYGQFVNGPYLQLLAEGTHGVNPYTYQDVQGDGFMDERSMVPLLDENGNIVPEQTYLKNNNGVDDYTAQFMSTIQNGVIVPSEQQIAHAGGGMSVGKYNNGMLAEGETPTYSKGGSGTGHSGGSGSSDSSGGSYEDYINQMYSEALKAQLAQLESSYKQNISELDASVGKVDSTYNEQKRQADGLAEQNAASWREMANAYGLNSGAIGQAALAQNNQKQSDLNTLSAAQAQAQAEIERQRTLLGQQYQLQINQAIAENNYQKAEMLYQEAVRADEALRQQEQQNADMMLQYAQMAMQQQQYNSDLALQYAKLAGTGSSGSGNGTSSDQVITTPDYIAAYQAALESGNEANFLASKDLLKPYGITSTEGLWDGYEKWESDTAALAGKTASETYKAMSYANTLRSKHGSNGDMLANLMAAEGFSTDAIGAALDRLGIK